MWFFRAFHDRTRTPHHSQRGVVASTAEGSAERLNCQSSTHSRRTSPYRGGGRMHTHVTESANPSVAARQIDNERYLSLALSLRNWQLTSGALRILSIGLGAGIVYVNSQPNVIPYSVEVDATGRARALAEPRSLTVADPLAIQNLSLRAPALEGVPVGFSTTSTQLVTVADMGGNDERTSGWPKPVSCRCPPRL